MRKENIDFLKKLQHEMLTQDTFLTANPRFWVVKELKKTYWIEEDYDGVEAVYDCESIGENLKELYEFLIDQEEDLIIEYVNDDIEEYIIIKRDEEDEDGIYFYEVKELVEYMDLEMDYDGIYCVNFKEDYEIVENTLFLTYEDCVKHIESNSYHYKNPIAYCMHAWRNPNLQTLFNIIAETNWDSLSDEKF